MTITAVEATVGPYLLHAPLGSSGLATTYRATDTASQKTIALKVLHAYYSQEDDVVAAFFSELERIAALDHPNILPPLAWGKDGQRIWVASEFRPEGSLRTTWHTPGSLNAVVQITAGIADALEHALSRSITHRNLKPSNVFWDRSSGSLALGDFGTALLGERAHPLLRTALTTPMPAYMAPEYIASGEANAQSETFSLAVLAYWLLTGSVPYVAEAPSTMHAKAMRYQITQPSEVNPAVTHDMEQVLVHALAPFPHVRPASPAVFAEALRDATPIQPETSVVQEPSFTLSSEAPLPLPTMMTSGMVIGRLWQLPSPRSTFRERLKRIGVVGLFAAASVLGYAAITQPPAIGAPSTSISADVSPSHWVLPRYDSLNTGFVPLSTKDIKGELKWVFKTNQPFQAAPATDGSTVYAATGDNRLVALDLDTGTPRWEYATTGPVDAQPVIAGDLVYLGLRDKRILAVDKATGALRWQFATDNPVTSGGVVDAGVLFQGSTDGKLYALDAASGKLLWNFDTTSSISAPPTVMKDVIIVVSRDGWIHFLERATGRPRFIFFTSGAQYSAPAVHNDRVYVASAAQRLFAIDVNERSSFMDRQIYWARVQLWIFQMAPQPEPPKGYIWAARLPSRQATDPAVAHGKVYVGTESGKLVAVDENSGKQVWEFSSKSPMLGSPIVSQDTLYAADDDGKLYALNPETGKELWAFTADGRNRTGPIIAKNTLLFTSENGNLYALR